MYWKLFVEKAEGRFSRSGRRLILAGLAALSVLLVVGLLIAYRYSALETSTAVAESAGTQAGAGGQDAIVLKRLALGEAVPEFLSATLLPGSGLDVAQITAFIPGRGEVKLLAAADARESSTAGGAFLVPWAGRLGGVAAISWSGHSLQVPEVDGGLLLRASAASVEENPMPGGGAAIATFVSGDHNGRWPSDTETKISVVLAGRALELTVLVKNTGEEATPVGIGWAPRFAISEGGREQVTLHVPAAGRVVADQNRGGAMPTGELDAVKGTAYDFNAAGGVGLGRHGLDDTFTGLRGTFDGHPAIELRDPAGRFGVRIVALTPSIKAVHVSSPVDGGFVAISPRMNLDDPFGKEWAEGVDTGMVVLQPGQTVEWKVRVELFAL